MRKKYITLPKTLKEKIKPLAYLATCSKKSYNTNGGKEELANRVAASACIECGLGWLPLKVEYKNTVIRNARKQIRCILDKAGSKPIGREGFLDDTKPIKLTTAKAEELALAAEVNNPTKLHKESFEANKHKL